MKIAFVVINANRYEGTSRAVLEVAERLAVNHQVDLWARTADEDATRRLQWRRLKGPGRPEVADFMSFKWLADRRLKRGDYDIVHSAGPNTSIADVYTIQTVHPVKMQQIAAARAKDSAGWVRRMSWKSYDECVIRAERAAYHATGNRGPRAFLPVSLGTQTELLEYYPQVGLDRENSNVFIVPNGADLKLFHPENRPVHRSAVRQEHGLSESDFVLVFGGGDWRRKGLDLAINAISRIENPSIKLLVVGNDRAGADIRKMSNELGVEQRVIFAGFRSDVHRYYAAGDLFLFPTSYEAFSVATIEAASSGLPVLMSDVSGAKELVGSGLTGAIIRRDSEHIASEILRFYHSPDLVHKTGIAARRLVEQEFSWDKVVDKTLVAYESVLERRKEGPQVSEDSIKGRQFA